MSLAYVYFEEEPGPASGGKAAHTGRGAADRCEHRQAAEVVGQAAIIQSSIPAAPLSNRSIKEAPGEIVTSSREPYTLALPP